jgi:hypothetical protein
MLMAELKITVPDPSRKKPGPSRGMPRLRNESCIIKLNRSRLSGDLTRHMRDHQLSKATFCEETGISPGSLDRIIACRSQSFDPILSAITFMGRRVSEYLEVNVDG